MHRIVRGHWAWEDPRSPLSLTSYPDYFLTSLSPSPRPASAVTLLTSVPGAGHDPAVLCWVSGAEAIWLAGGDQWDYLGLWPPRLHQALGQLNARGGAIGGTSAGAASELHGALVDSHFSDRGREGRLLGFLARFLSEKNRTEVLGIGLDEGVALVIEGGGYRVYAPAGQFAWFYRVTGPSRLENGVPLDLSGIQRVRSDAGTEGPWPPDFGTLQTSQLQVRGGVVGPVE